MRIARSLVDQVITTAGGYRRSTTVMGALTGLGGDLFILDDPQKAVDAQSEARRNSINQWFSNTLISRLDNKKTGAIIIVMQRVHMNDLCGHVTEASDEWTALSLSAIAEADERIQIGDETSSIIDTPVRRCIQTTSQSRCWRGCREPSAGRTSSPLSISSVRCRKVAR